MDIARRSHGSAVTVAEGLRFTLHLLLDTIREDLVAGAVDQFPALHPGRWMIAGMFVEIFGLVAVGVRDQKAVTRPRLDRDRLDTQQVRGLLDRQQTARPESVVARLQLVVAPEPFDQQAMKGAPGAGHVAFGIQLRRDLPCGVVVQALIDQGDDLRTGLAQLPRGERRREMEAGRGARESGRGP